MTTKDKTDLTQMSKYSLEHQACIVKLLIEDNEFRFKAMELIDINSLNAEESIRTIAGIVKVELLGKLKAVGTCHRAHTPGMYLKGAVEVALHLFPEAVAFIFLKEHLSLFVYELELARFGKKACELPVFYDGRAAVLFKPAFGLHVIGF